MIELIIPIRTAPVYGFLIKLSTRIREILHTFAVRSQCP